MALRNVVLGGVAVLGLLAAGWFYRENGRLQDELARAKRLVAASDTWSRPAATAGEGAPSSSRGWRSALPLPRLGGKPVADDKPAGDKVAEETRGERRQRRQREMADLLGRDPDESEEDYRSRLLPFMQMALEKPRANVDEMRKAAEAAAKVTDDQKKQLDAAFDEVYAELIDYTNGAITDGQLTPYDRNVKGILQYAGGLGAILEGAEGRIGKVLSKDQLKTMSETGFEWGEYLGVRAPWESLRPPPPRPPGS